MNPVMRDLLRGLALVALIICSVSWLTGCGGGDPEPDAVTPRTNCALQPVVCA